MTFWINKIFFGARQTWSLSVTRYMHSVLNSTTFFTAKHLKQHLTCVIG